MSRLTHGCTGTPEYRTWQFMKDRCLNSNNKDYHHYGGRGISVCDRWLNSFENFFEDMGKKPSPELTLDRANNSGNYEPENCAWITRKAQAGNTRKQRWFYAVNKESGKICKSNNQRVFAREHKLDQRMISACLHGKQTNHRGWSFNWLESS